MDCSPPGSSVHGDSPGKNTGVGNHALLQGLFPIQGLNPGLPHCRRLLYHLTHQGSPRILEWVACPSSRGSSWPRNQTRVSCITGRFFTNWAMREALARTPSLKPHTLTTIQLLTSLFSLITQAIWRPTWDFPLLSAKHLVMWLTNLLILSWSMYVRHHYFP